MDKDYFEVGEEDFIVRIRPSVIANEWTGEVDIAIMTSAQNNLDDESYGQMMHFTKMICATVPLMEVNEDMRNFVNTYVLEEIDKTLEPMVEKEDDVALTYEDGNVVHLNFGTKTKGNA